MNSHITPPQLTHRMLEVFASVVSNSGISAAARALNISQPSVSRAIDDLESATGLLLFIKRGRVVVPTPEAAALFSEVENSFVGLRQIAARAQQLHENLRGQLRIGCMPALGHSIMPDAISALHHEMPDIKVTYLVEDSLLLAQMVATRRIDIGFVAAGPYPTGVLKLKTFTGTCQCILPRGHPLAGARSITIEQLANEPFVALSSNSRVRQRLEELMKNSLGTFRLVAETRQASAASELVLRGLGVAIVGPWVTREHVRRGGASIRLEHEITYETDVIAHADSRLNQAARALLAYVAKHVEEATP